MKLSVLALWRRANLLQPLNESGGGNSLGWVSFTRRRFRRWGRLDVIHSRLRPAGGIPPKRHYRECRFSIHSKVTLEVRREPILYLRVQSPRMSRADQWAVGRCQKQTAAAVQHIQTGFVQIWPSDGFASPDTNVVSALRALTTATP